MLYFIARTQKESASCYNYYQVQSTIQLLKTEAL
jgi:hypothetical protein